MRSASSGESEGSKLMTNAHPKQPCVRWIIRARLICCLLLAIAAGLPAALWFTSTIHTNLVLVIVCCAFSLPVGGCAVVMLLSYTPAWWVKCSYGDHNLALSPDEEATLVSLDLPLDQFVMLGTHNSCHRASLFGWLFVRYWTYTHAPLTQQLEFGLRHIELDLWYNRTTCEWEVWHECVDALTVAPHTMKETLLQVRSWCANRKNHFPIVFNLDVKGAAWDKLSILVPLCSFGQLTKHDRQAFVHLQKEIESVWGREAIFGPADWLEDHKQKSKQEADGECVDTTLHAVVQKRGWPKVNTLKGKALFQINLYGSRRQCIDAIDCHHLCWVRCDNAAVPHSVYMETGNTSRAKEFVDRGYHVRCSVLTHNPPRLFGVEATTKEMIQKANSKLEDIHKSGAQLVPSNHPGWLNTKTTVWVAQSAQM